MEMKIGITGKLRIAITRKNGIIDVAEFDNLVVTTGRAHIADQLSDQLQAAMSHMAIGTGTTAPVIGDTALETELSRKAFTSKTLSANTVVYVADWAAGEATGAITEAGILNAASSGTLLNRVTFTVQNIGAEDTLSAEWTLTISG